MNSLVYLAQNLAFSFKQWEAVKDFWVEKVILYFENLVKTLSEFIVVV